MTTAQALMRGLPTAPAKSETSDAAAFEGGDESFGNALEMAFLAALDGMKSGGAPQKTLDDKPLTDEQKDAILSKIAEATGGVIPSASLVLAALEAAQAQAQTQATAANDTGDAATPSLVEGLALPGVETETGESEPIDASQLLKALSPDNADDVAKPVETAPAEVSEDVTLKVVRRETHLAVVRTSPLLAGDLAAASPASAETVQQVETQAGQLARDLQRSTNDTATDPAVEDAGPDASLTSRTLSYERPAHREFGQQASADGQPASSRDPGEGNGTASGTFALSLQTARTAQTGADDALAEAAYETPADQISSAVQSEIPVEGEDISTNGAVRVLQIELKPASLGAVTVRIALKDNAVTLHLEAQRADTLEAIERDREALAGSLRAAGYTVDSITSSVQGDTGRLSGILSGSFDAGYSGSQAGAQGSSAQSSGQDSAGSSGQGASGRSGQQDQGSGSGNGNERGSMARSGSDGLYV